MKKFVGLVNGKPFDNVEDWMKEAQEAIKNNDGTLGISSYYTYVDDGEEEKEALEEDNKHVSANEYFLGDRKPDKVEKLDSSMIGLSGYTNVEYTVSPELEEKLKVASNKNNIKKSINYHVEKLVNNIKDYKDDVRETEKKIEELQKKLYDQQCLLMDEEGRRKYYNNLLDILETPEPVEEKKDSEEKVEEKVEEKKEYVKPNIRITNIRELFGLDPETTLFDTLKQLGILK